MKTVCPGNQCAGCMACIDVCPKNAIAIKDGLSAYNAVIDEDKCIDCNLCHKVCQVNHPQPASAPLQWAQGWAINEELRGTCSSGGLATAVLAGFVENGGVICACEFRDGRFTFGFARSAEELARFSGSKYVKSDPSGVYKQIRNLLKEGERVLFIGLPCQVAAVKNFVGEGLQTNLYTIDLVCHGTPSPQLLEKFLNQYDVSLSDLGDIKFRRKTRFQIYGNYKSIGVNGISDRYSIAFVNGLIYTDNCYQCNYAKKERVSDLTLGDSWGSELPLEAQRKGVPLVLYQTEKGKELLAQAAVQMEPVNLEKAIEHNAQLKHPSQAPRSRQAFFKKLAQGKRFNKLVFDAFPKQCMRQNVKAWLIKCKVLRGGGS